MVVNMVEREAFNFQSDGQEIFMLGLDNNVNLEEKEF